MTLDELVKDFNGKFKEFDGAYPYQCVDLIKFYNRDVIGALPIVGNAVDMWTSYPKDSYTQVPYKEGDVGKKGDIVVWSESLGPNGHIAIYLDGDDHGFNSFDQNFPVGSPCHTQHHSHSYVLGFLRPKGGPNLMLTREELKPILVSINKMDKTKDPAKVEADSNHMLDEIFNNHVYYMDDLKGIPAATRDVINKRDAEVTALQKRIKELEGGGN